MGGTSLGANLPGGSVTVESHLIFLVCSPFFILNNKEGIFQRNHHIIIHWNLDDDDDDFFFISYEMKANMILT